MPFAIARRIARSIGEKLDSEGRTGCAVERAANSRAAAADHGGSQHGKVLQIVRAAVTVARIIAADGQRSLDALAEFDARKSRIAELQFFGGLSVAETAEVLKSSERTVAREWELAKSWLYRQLSKDPSAQ